MPASSYPSAGRGEPHSGSSSPYLPQTEEERTEREHQQEVDLHLATTMSRGMDVRRTRSRSRSGGKDMAIDEAGEVYRSLRDAQAEQDAHFFEASASPRREMLNANHRIPPSPNTAAARFYRQNRRRTLSDTSVDSQPGFIDHRGSQASMSHRKPGRKGDTKHLSPRDMVKKAARSKSSRLRAEAQTSEARENSEDSDNSEEENDQERVEEDMRASSSVGSPTKSHARTPTGASISALSSSRPETSTMTEAMSARGHRASFDMPKDGLQEDYNDGMLEGSALATDGMEDEPGVVDHRDHGPSSSHHSALPREYLQRRSSRDSGHSRRSQRSDRSKRRGSGDQNQNATPSLSRRPSDEHKVEEDVCYPMLEMREADMEGRGHREDSPSRDDSDRMHRRSFNNTYNLGMPGVLPNFPFPFDFNALEDFCEEDREKHGIAIPKARKADHNTGMATSAQSAQSGTRAISFSPDKSDGEGGMRKRMNGGISRRQRKLSESVGSGHVGRYQRKLAIFEGGSVGGPRLDDKADVSVKTPLLTGESKTRPGFGATTNGTHRSINSAAEKARPYRFSFYSNALPSTIHARSLAEIPAEGQTFEELFVGRSTSSPPPEEWEGSLANGADVNINDSALPAQKPGSTGYNTPVGGPGATGPSLSSYKTGGGVLGNMHRSGTGTYQPKPRTQLMRSIEDAEANTWWLDVLCPTDAEMKVLGKVFGIHPLTIEDILMEETREKIELFRNYYLVCFRSFDQDPYSPTYLEALNMYIVVFREGTLSFHFRGTPHPQNVRRRIKQLKDFINVTSDWISYALIDDITDAFGPLIQNIEYEVDSIDELVLILKDAEQSDMLRRIGTCRKKVMGLLRLMGNKADVVKGLAKRCNENWSVAPKSDIGLYLSDIQDHLITMTQNLNHYEKILSRSHSNYLAQISIEMTDANNQINDVLSKLTALGTVLIPMNLVTGLWGMNVRVPGEGVENLHWFFGIVSVLLAFALAGGYLTYRAFRK